MKNTGKLVIGLIGAAVVIGLIVLVIKIISGAFALLGGFLNTLLGIAVVVAMVAIVIWMLSYAKKKH